MVIEDVFSPKRSPRDPNSEWTFAGPIERAVAGILDLFIAAQVTLVLLIPLEQKIETAKLLGLTEQNLWGRILQIACVGLGILIYQTLMLHSFRATVGMMLFKLRFRSMGEFQITASDCLLRSLLFLGSIILLGAPFLGIYRHKNRRTFVDLATDTAIVCVDPKKRFHQPDFSEQTFALFLRSMSLMGLAMLSGIIFASIESQVNSSDQIYSQLESSGKLCPEVALAVRNWNPQPSESRLAISLALFSAGAINAECLKNEAAYSLWTNSTDKLGYLAMALTLSPEKQDYSKYTENVCEKNLESLDCIYLKSSGYERDVALIQNKKINPGAQTFWRLEIAKSYISLGRAAAALRLLKDDPPVAGLATYWNLLKADAKMAEGNFSESQALLAWTGSFQNRDYLDKFLSRACVIESSLGCEKSSFKSCSQLTELDFDFSATLSHEIYRGILRSFRCEKKDQLVLTSLPSTDSEALNIAFRLLQVRGTTEFDSVRDEADVYLTKKNDSDANALELFMVRAELAPNAKGLDKLLSVFERLFQREPYRSKALAKVLVEKFTRDHLNHVSSRILGIIQKPESGINRLPASAESHGP